MAEDGAGEHASGLEAVPCNSERLGLEATCWGSVRDGRAEVREQGGAAVTCGSGDDEWWLWAGCCGSAPLAEGASGCTGVGIGRLRTCCCCCCCWTGGDFCCSLFCAGDDCSSCSCFSFLSAGSGCVACSCSSVDPGRCCPCDVCIDPGRGSSSDTVLCLCGRGPWSGLAAESSVSLPCTPAEDAARAGVNAGAAAPSASAWASWSMQ